MTIKKSIKSLESLKLKIPADERTEELWLIQTSSLIESFFGIESKEFKFIETFNFQNSIVRQTDFIYKGYSGDTVRLDTDYKVIASQFLDNCIDTIKTKGIYKDPKKGFLSKYSDKEIFGTFATILIFFCGLCYNLGQNNSSNKIEKLEIENKKLTDSISSIIRVSSTSTQPQKITKIDTTNTEKSN